MLHHLVRTTRCLGKTLATAVFGTLLSLSVQAAYPEKPIRLVVPFPPGGAMDGLARALSDPLGRKFGQTIVVENKSGAGGNLGVEAVAKSPADGYTMVITSIGMVTNRHLYAKLGYDPLKDFAPVTQLAVVPNMLVINPAKVKARTVPELIAEAKAQPGQLTYASAGNGTSIHLSGELFTAMTGTDMQHIPYRGSGPAVSDLIGGQVGMMFDSIASARPHVQSGKLIALALTTARRSPSLPDLPTLAESGVAGYEVAPWFGIFMPAGTPKDVVRTMHNALTEAMQLSEVKARFSVLGAEVIGQGPEAFAATLAAENTKWEKLIRERRIQAD
jgi:tripartite-type tricarboxylate transporter receptor subunit TctC